MPGDQSRELTDALLEVIRERMAEQNLLGYRLAERAGIPRSTFARHLNGEGHFNVDELDAVAVVLGIATVEDLLTEARTRL